MATTIETIIVGCQKRCYLFFICGVFIFQAILMIYFSICSSYILIT